MTVYRPIIAATRILEVLAAVNALGRARLSEVAQRTELSLPTALRMLETLEASGYVRRRAEGGYSVTARVLELSSSFRIGEEIAAAARPLLVELQRRIGWPSDVAVFEGGSMLVVATSRGDDPFFSNRQPGYRAPLRETSLGRAYLAWSDAAARKQAIAAAGGPALSAKQLDAIRKRGYGVMSESYSATGYGGAVASLGVPVLLDGKPAAAVNVMYLRQAMSERAAAAKLLAPLRQVARNIAAAIASEPGELDEAS